MSGYEFLSKIRNQWPDLPVLMLTAYATPKLAVEAIKPVRLITCPNRSHRRSCFTPSPAAPSVTLLRENAALRSRANETFSLDQIVGESQKIRELRKLIQTVAPLTGACSFLRKRHGQGAGRRRIARIEPAARGELHPHQLRRHPRHSARKRIVRARKGSFTGALKQKPGRVEEADGGTIFLDEIADMSKPLQAKLLRFLEDGTFTRVGGTHELRVNVRLIAATNRNITQAIAEGQFREDLFHRLNVVQFRLPLLRDRMGMFCCWPDIF